MAYIFDPEIVHECSMLSLGKPKPEMFDAFAEAMEVQYPDRLDLDQPWIFSNAGGAMIQMKLYYASVFRVHHDLGHADRLRGPLGPARGGLLGHGSRWRDVVLRRGAVREAGVRTGGPGVRGPEPGPGDELHHRRLGCRVRARAAAAVHPFGVADELVSTSTSPPRPRPWRVRVAGRTPLAPAAPDGEAPSLLRRTLGSVLASVAPVVTRIVRPPEPDDTVPTG